ncbi:hypothetical protein BU23DRAFT_191377 [Bimuria novae-zelandiae CBS 107.79]|uniref:Uncharacterized protein n=1 Tax=Bimuria novae-zelandiae CBS 107.79 TaxID=1447943 RepID=A0A6A5VML9_9PLEO|nr:hypothetical protein BU23DRAFT_191377 [Bimuria novae-zelandiae CBS 107.79]
MESQELLSDADNDISYNSDLDEFVINNNAERSQGEHAVDSAEDDRSDTEDAAVALTALTNGTHSPLTTATIAHVPLLPEYPQTSTIGYSYCVHVDPTRATGEMILQDAQQFQYCRRQKGPPKRTTSVFLGGPAMRYRYECTGIKRCEYLDNGLANLSHTHVTDEIWEQMKGSRLNLYRSEPDARKKKSTALYQAVMHRYRNRTTCVYSRDTCAPVLRQMRHEAVSGDRLWYIGCSSWTYWNKAEGHLFKTVGAQYNIPHLQSLFENGLPEDPAQAETCGAIFLTRTKLHDCDVNHPQGKGKLLKVGCGVQYDIIIPIYVSQSLHYIFTSHGIHTHPPPPPTRTPEALTQDIVSLIRRVNDPSMTVASFLKSPFLKELCKRYSRPSFTQIHQSLANMDRLAQVIYREKLVMFPSGQDLAGVEFEMNIRHQDPEEAYIREIVTNNLGSIVLTMYKQQAIVFASLETFQVDLSFKRVARGFHELIFAFYHEQHGKLFTLARMYINCERRRIYQRCFEILFKHVSQCTRKEIRWKHLHNNGFIGVTVDMDGKQMSGFGRYLQSVDSSSRPWQWQLQNTVNFCTAHFLRSIRTATGGIDPAFSTVRQRMTALLTCQSWEEYDTLCAQLIEHESPIISSWAKHKRNIVIAAGLNRNITLMTQRDWNILEKTSNNVKQATKKSYSFKKLLYLLPAILAVQNLDQRDIDQFNSRVERDIRHSHRSTSLVSRYSTAMAKQKRKRHGHYNQETGHNSDDDGDDAILFQASSLGYVRARSSSRQRQSLNTRDSLAPDTQSTTQESDLTSTSTSTLSKRVAIPLRSPSSQPSLQRQVLQQNLDAQSQRTALELREKEAIVRKQELQNRLLELELLERERALSLGNQDPRGT